ncbi:divergent PAP2 family protein [Paenibacillus roseipurpureus]|uniref:Divergent PAP2 family protein n=1 Tax=Paenibacillus roseopurpureus TaxID=2918901 RepID=A0AA96LSK9_9BACL|nr:divergent PAP2 family protein [Paenibacillus sp. MBLB1832]WNR46501.1 divergent PAP2 family protein [Paenibacillus sp. MBLB1832]
MNRALTTAALGIGAAQVIKVPLTYMLSKKWDWSQMVQTGGMPSSHSCGVTALATYICLKRGYSAIDFAVSSVFGAVVMYDAMGIRRSAGEIAVEVNDLDEQVERLSRQHPGLYHAKRRKALKERLGHLPREVAAGALLGLAIGACSYLLERK